MKYQVSLAILALLEQGSCTKLNREPLLTWSPTPADGGPPKDYFVPHFGTDTDMKNVKISLVDAEKIVGEKMTDDVIGHPMADPNPRNYFVPNFGEDHDITASKKSTALAEG